MAPRCLFLAGWQERLIADMASDDRLLLTSIRSAVYAGASLRPEHLHEFLTRWGGVSEWHIGLPPDVLRALEQTNDPSLRFDVSTAPCLPFMFHRSPTGGTAVFLNPGLTTDREKTVALLAASFVARTRRQFVSKHSTGERRDLEGYILIYAARLYARRVLGENPMGRADDRMLSGLAFVTATGSPRNRSISEIAQYGEGPSLSDAIRDQIRRCANPPGERCHGVREIDGKRYTFWSWHEDDGTLRVTFSVC